ncbi:hypothetical protein KPL39_03965 [Clostridium gasigenes]|nr:hypothetical protein [Clostridium gasigenes]MBU3135420.1 hypothetical protein [Clostridium gasigenes]
MGLFLFFKHWPKTYKWIADIKLDGDEAPIKVFPIIGYENKVKFETEN